MVAGMEKRALLIVGVFVCLFAVSCSRGIEF